MASAAVVWARRAWDPARDVTNTRLPRHPQPEADSLQLAAELLVEGVYHQINSSRVYPSSQSCL